MSEARAEADRQPADLYAAFRKLYNGAIGDDLHVAGDPSQPIYYRLLHTGIAGVTVLSVAGGPETLGLKLAAKEIVKGGTEQVTYHAISQARVAKPGS